MAHFDAIVSFRDGYFLKYLVSYGFAWVDWGPGKGSGKDLDACLQHSMKDYYYYYYYYLYFSLLIPLLLLLLTPTTATTPTSHYFYFY
jgi:hypothetical protein